MEQSCCNCITAGRQNTRFKVFNEYNPSLNKCPYCTKELFSRMHVCLFESEIIKYYTSGNLHIFNLKSQGCMITSIWLWNWNKHLRNHPILEFHESNSLSRPQKGLKIKFHYHPTSLVGGLGILVPNSSSSTAASVQIRWTQRNKNNYISTEHITHTHTHTSKLKEHEEITRC